MIDTNILVYAEGGGDERRVSQVINLISEFGSSLVVPALALGELYRVLTRKLKYKPETARTRVNAWSRSYEIADIAATTMTVAVEVAVRHRIHIWDAVIIAVARETGCGALLSEDMQANFRWEGVRIINPFTTAEEEIGRLFSS